MSPSNKKSKFYDEIWFRLLMLFSLFLVSCLWLWLLVDVLRPNILITRSKRDDDDSNESKDFNQKSTTVNNEHEQTISFPSNLQELKLLSKILVDFSKTNPEYVLLLFCSAYLFKQTFAIPGSVFLNLLGGAIYGTWIAFPLCCLLTAFGATFCYCLSWMAGTKIMEHFFPHKLQYFRNVLKNKTTSTVTNNSSRQAQESETNNESSNNIHLLWILISLRLFPMTPNWFLNIASPVVGIPVSLFFPSVLFGLMPYNMICVQTGSILSSIKSMDDIFTIKTMAGMLAIATGVAMPTLLTKYFNSNKRNDNKTTNHKHE